MLKYIIGLSYGLLTPDSADGGNNGVTQSPANTTNGGNNSGDEEDAEGDTIIGEINGVNVKKMEFKKSKKTGTASAITGFGFPSLCFGSPSEMVTHFENLAKSQGKSEISGKDVVLDLAQSAYDAKLRIKVMASIPKVGDSGYPTQAEVDAWFAKREENNPDKLLLTKEDVYSWIPGLRELSDKKLIQQTMEQVKALMFKPGYGPTHPEVQALLVKVATQMANK
jgi:hypothetical protein